MSEVMTQIINIISSVGFPIAACIALFYMINKELRQVREAIDNNTRALVEMVDHFNKNERG